MQAGLRVQAQQINITGEKLFEEIITDGEGIIHSDHEKIMVLKGSEHDPKLLNGNLEELFTVAAHNITQER